MANAAVNVLSTKIEPHEQFRKTVFRLLSLVLATVICSILLLSELSKRVDFNQSLSKEIDRIQLAPTQGSEEKQFRIELTILQDRLQTMMALGSLGPTHDLQSIYCDFERSKTAYLTRTSEFPQISSCSADFSAGGLHAIPQAASAFLSWPRSELLLMFLMVLCGTIGACGAVLIGGREKFALRRGIAGIAVVGLGAGFLMYLVLKGGRAFFLFNSEISVGVVSNPFPMSLAAALGGMFAKELFEKLDDWMEKKLKAAEEEKDEMPPKS